MGNRKEIPTGHTKDDFECFGPPAEKDGEFAGTKLCDMGCFKQGETDSNKYYHAAVVKSKKNGKWFAYYEWGRVGGSNDFQFIECSSEAEAQETYEDQLHSKNDKRGQWTTVAGIRTLEPKPGKDCYLVRPQAVRATGLPDARRIVSNTGAKTAPVKTAQAVVAAPSKPRADQQTLELMKDLNVATVSYTKGEMADASIPTQKSIDEARQVLQEARKRLADPKGPGNDIKAQVADKDLVQFTSFLYSRIPKKKSLNAAPDTWILSSSNIVNWDNDLNAFESALVTTTNSVAVEKDPFDGMPLDMEWLDPKSSMGAFVYRFAPKATRNRHGGVGNMKIRNAWRVSRHGDEAKLFAAQDKIAAERGKHWVNETALHQPDALPHAGARKDVYKNSHTCALFHGTRMVNVSGILRKALLLPRQLVGVAITGAMFGGGLYFADDWKKSAGYTDGGYYARSSRGGRSRGCFMFIADVVLGNPHVAPGPRGYTSAPKGHHCVFGKADVSAVQNNEWIVFDTDQNMLRYLMEYEEA